MIDSITGSAKAGLKSIFTAEKYGIHSLEEDLDRIIFIRNYLDEILIFLDENYENENAEDYFEELKNFALELFLNQCKDAISEEEMNSENFDIETHQKEDIAYFNYNYDNLKYPD